MMCHSPSFPPGSIGSYWTDEQIVICLDKLMKGSPLPEDVIADMNPYEFRPSNLPEGIWYFLHSGEKKETKLGSWNARGEDCQVYEDSNITGWRTTLDFFEGLPLSLKKTDWVMQEYKITQNGQREKNKLKDSRILCIVFSCGGEVSSSGVQSKLNDSDTTARHLVHSKSTMPSIEIKCAHHCGSSMKNKESLAVEELPDQISEAILELDYILRDDYLELDDLVDQESGCSSSDNSSCVSITSDECFDSLALLRDLEDDINKDLQDKASKLNFSVAGSAKFNEVILQPATLGSITKVSWRESSAEEVAYKRAKADPTNEVSKSHSDKSVVEVEKDSHSKKNVKKKSLFLAIRANQMVWSTDVKVED